MLRSLYINHIAIIDQLEVEFHENMTAITGETGAGKSIVIDALALALGARADQSLLSHGQDKAQIIAEFDISENALTQDWLKKKDLDNTELSCILQRNLYQNKPSKSLINGRPVSLLTLKALGDKLVSICGQQEHLTLTQPAKQLEALDNYAQLNEQLNICKNLNKQITKLNQEITQLEHVDKLELDELSMLRFLINELNEGEFSSQEYRQLDEEQTRLAHTTDIANAVNSALDSLKNNDASNITSGLSQVIQQLSQVKQFDPKINNIIELIHSCSILCEESSSELERLASNLDFDPARLHQAENRLSQYHDMARKHQTQAACLSETLDSLSERLERLNNRDESLKQLKTHYNKLRENYQGQADILHNKRHQCAIKLGLEITAQMQELGLKGSIFEIECIQDKNKISAKGQDSVRFLIATNTNQPTQTIEKVASGGELSRISLALQLQLTSITNSSVLVFDEVDTGISGQTANLVGNKLKDLGMRTQIICITHLPQVASKGHHQLKITKTNGTNKQVKLNYLSVKDRIYELARMLSGADVTNESMANAKVMLDQT